jgi:hypothetical protein
MSLWSRHDESHGHFRRYGEADLHSMWEGLPVRTRLVSPFNWRLYPPVRLARILGRRRDRTVGRGDTDIAPLPTALNAILRRVFEGEASALVAGLDSGVSRSPWPGVSWLAVLQKGR